MHRTGLTVHLESIAVHLGSSPVVVSISLPLSSSRPFLLCFYPSSRSMVGVSIRIDRSREISFSTLFGAPFRCPAMKMSVSK